MIKTKLERIEKRFLEVSKLDIDLSQYPLFQNTNQQVKTDKKKSDKHGEVFTPLWLVDKMLDLYDEWDQDRTTEDLCSGYGQFSIRMLRKKYSILQENFDIERFLTQTHLFSEYQPSSCFMLLYVFGTDIRLLMGDVLKRASLSQEAENGIWILTKGEWKDKTLKVKQLFKKHNTSNPLNDAQNFEKDIYENFYEPST